jgi:hypothetical protein
MANNLEFIFKTEDMKKLVEANTDFIVIHSYLEGVVLDNGQKAGALRVHADAVNKGKGEAVDTIQGCPNPPCSTEQNGL